MQAGMHTGWQGGREARMQAGMHTDWQGGRLGCRRGCIQAGREGG